MDPLLFALVFLVSLLAALIDVMVGGGSLITVPALGGLGFSLKQVIATNRLYIVFFTIIGLANYWHKKIHVDLRPILVLIVTRSIGAYLGANAILEVDASSIKLIVAGFLFAAIIAIIFLETQKTKKLEFFPNAQIKIAVVAILFFILGYYEGFVGGGGSTIARLLMLLFLGMPLLEAGIAELIMTLVTSTISSGVFLYNGQVDFVLLIPMVLGGIIGGFIGSHIAIKKGTAWLRPLLFVIVGLLLVKLVFF